MLINPGTVTSQEASLPVLLIGRRIVAISIARTKREYNTILLDCVSHYRCACLQAGGLWFESQWGRLFFKLF